MKKALWIHLALVTGVSLLAYTGTLHSVEGWNIPFFDKMLHFVLVGGISFWWTAGWGDPHHSWWGRRVPIALVVPLVGASCEEAMQALSPHRSSNLLDWLANVLGIITFWWLARQLLALTPEEAPESR